MKRTVHVAFAYFWRSFSVEAFRLYFASALEKYDIVVSDHPAVVFYSVFDRPFPVLPGGQYHYPAVSLPRGDYVRVLLTGENVEPDMSTCEFAISYSRRVVSPNHLYLPAWVYESRAWGYPPEALVKSSSIDWEKVAAGKTRFCNFLYSHNIEFRNELFRRLSCYKRVDAPGKCMNNMSIPISFTPNRTAGKIAFLNGYKFTLAVEAFAAPGYTTEKLVDPMFARSIPIYVGDEIASETFDRASYVDGARFSSVTEMFDFVREVDNDRDLYMRMLAAPNYRNNTPPAYASEQRIVEFFDRIFETVA